MCKNCKLQEIKDTINSLKVQRAINMHPVAIPMSYPYPHPIITNQIVFPAYGIPVTTRQQVVFAPMPFIGNGTSVYLG